MKKTAAALVFVGLAAGIGLAAMARQEGMPPATKPGKEHEWLKSLEGTWTFAGEFYMAGPEKPPIKSKGTQTDKLGCNGLWLVIDAKEEGGMNFHGHGMLGYDGAKQKYVSTWVDSMSTTIMGSEGTVDKDGKVLTMNGEATHEGVAMKFREVTTLKDKDHKTMEMYIMGGDGKEMKMGVLEYTRKK